MRFPTKPGRWVRSGGAVVMVRERADYLIWSDETTPHSFFLVKDDGLWVREADAYDMIKERDRLKEFARKKGINVDLKLNQVVWLHDGKEVVIISFCTRGSNHVVDPDDYLNRELLVVAELMGNSLSLCRYPNFHKTYVVSSDSVHTVKPV